LFLYPLRSQCLCGEKFCAKKNPGDSCGDRRGSDLTLVVTYFPAEAVQSARLSLPAAFGIRACALLKGFGVDFSKTASARIDGNSRMLQCNHAEKRFAIFRAEDDLGHGFSADETHPGEAIVHFNWPAVGHLIDRLAFGFDARGPQTAGGSQTIHRAGI